MFCFLVCSSYFGHLSGSSHRLSCCGHAAISFGGGCCRRGCYQCKVLVCHDCGCSNSLAAMVFVVGMIGQVVIVVFVTVVVVFVALVVVLIAGLAVVDFLFVFGDGGPKVCVVAS